MVRTRKGIYVGNKEVKRRYIGNKLIFEILGDMDKVKVSGVVIFTDKADNSVVHVEVDGKSIGGGKNLLPLSYEEFQTIQVGAWGTNLIPDISKQFNLRDMGLKVGDTVTISSEIRGSVATRYRIDDQDGFNVYTSSSPYVTNGRLVATFEIAERTTEWFSVAYDNQNEYDSSTGGVPYNIEVKNQMIEKGSTATEYEPPAPTTETHSLNDFDVVSSVGKRNLAEYDNWLLTRGEAVGNYSFILTSDKDGNGTYLRQNGKNLKVEPKEDYTLSFKIRKLSGNLLKIRGHTPPNFEISSPTYVDGIKISEAFTGTGNLYEPLDDGEWHQVVVNMKSAASITDTALFYIQPNGLSYEAVSVEIKDVMFEKGNIATDWTPAPEDVTEIDNHPLIDKINISLSEPLRSVGGVKDRLFRDNDGLWKIERNVNVPGVEILSQDMQDKLNNLRSFQDSNYVYTIINDILPTVAEDLKPTLHATFKSEGWYDDYKNTLLQ